MAENVVHHSNDLFFRGARPWRLGLVRLDAGDGRGASARGCAPAPAGCASARGWTSPIRAFSWPSPSIGAEHGWTIAIA